MVVDSKEWLTIPEFAAEMGASIRTVYRWLADGTISYWQPRPGAMIRIHRQEIENNIWCNAPDEEENKI